MVPTTTTPHRPQVRNYDGFFLGGGGGGSTTLPSPSIEVYRYTIILVCCFVLSNALSSPFSSSPSSSYPLSRHYHIITIIVICSSGGGDSRRAGGGGSGSIRSTGSRALFRGDDGNPPSTITPYHIKLPSHVLVY